MKKRNISLSLFIGLFLALAIGLPAGAQEPITPIPVPIEPPIIMPPIWNFDGLRIDYQRVDVEIENQVATTYIDQLFVNDNDWMLEGIYLFPLPEGAAVSQLTMWVDGQPIEAKILEAGEARQIYDEIVRQLRDPALLEYVGTSAIQANVFPIPPRDERRIEIAYSQVLPADNGLIKYVYPQSTNLYTNTVLDEQSIRVDIHSNEAIRAIYSPSHKVAIDRNGDFRATVGYEDENVQADTDFELYYTVSPEEIGLNLLSYKESDQDGFFLLLAAPPFDVDTDRIISKDIILVLDTSGSMSGEKMAQAREAAIGVVEQLNSQDRFNIISFSTGTRSFNNSLQSVEEAGNYRSFINGLDAVGGTNISQALLEAVGQAKDDRPTTIIFLTDGLATEGIVDTELLLDSVAQQTPNNVRIFAFGVGDDVDTLLLDTLTGSHGGTTTYVRPGQSIEEAVSSFYAKISMPVLANIELDFDDIVVEQMFPQELPDLFAGSQLLLAGRYREGGPAAITLSGEVNGDRRSFTYEDNIFRNSGGDDFIPRLWATRAIGHLLTQIRLHGEDEELVQSIVNLSLRYGIITPYTSYLIEEDDIFTQTGREELFQESMDFFSEPAETSGAAAVDKAADERFYAEAQAPIEFNEAPSLSGEGQLGNTEDIVKFVGSKTFVFQDGLWIDTTYDANGHDPQQVGFASDAYFELLSAVPQLGQYLSLGQRVLVVHQGIAYEIVEGEGSGEVTIPVEIDSGDPDPDLPSGNDPVLIVDNDSDDDGNNAQEVSSGICGLALAAPTFAAAIFIVGRKRYL